MTNSIKDEIIAKLPKLSQSELKEVQAICSHLFDQSGAFTAPAGALTALVIDAISGALNGTASLQTLPAALVKRLEGRLTDFKAFLDRDFRGWDDNKTRQKAFLLRLFELLREDLIHIHIKPTYSTMINTLPRMPEVFDAAFPDYRASGMGHLILKHGGRLGLSHKKISGKL